MKASVTRSTLSRRLGRRLTATSTETAGTTWHSTVAAPTAFTRVRLIFESIEAGSTTITSAAVAVTATLASHPTPTTGTWVPVTFGGSASGTIPIGISATNPSVYKSDWIDINSVARTDKYFAPLPLVMARVYFAGTGYSFAEVAPRYIGWSESPVSFSESWKTSSQVVDGVASPSAFTSTVDRNTNVIIGYEFDTVVKGATVLNVGDSLSSGSLSCFEIRSAAAIACGVLSTPLEPIGLVNRGWSAASTTQFLESGTQALADYNPSVAIYRGFSPNDSRGTQAAFDDMLTRASTFAASCVSAGVIPIITNGVVLSFITGTQSTRRTALNAQLLALASSSVYVVDTNSATSDGASPERFLPRMDCGDQIHMFDPGYEAEARALIPVLRSILY